VLPDAFRMCDCVSGVRGILPYRLESSIWADPATMHRLLAIRDGRKRHDDTRIHVGLMNIGVHQGGVTCPLHRLGAKRAL